MSASITRSFSLYTIVIKSSTTGEVFSTSTTNRKPDKKRIAINTIKERGEMDFIIEITKKKEKREMTLETFLQYSTIVEDNP